MIVLLALSLLAQDVESSPLPIERNPPVYPSIGQMHGVLAKCTSRYDILPDGSSSNICVVCNTSLPAFIPQSVSEYVINQFVAEARAAISQWRFEPSAQGARGKITDLEFSLADVDGDDAFEWPGDPEPHQCPDNPIT